MSNVEWAELDDNLWLIVFSFLGMDAFTLRRVCTAFQRRIVPIDEMPQGLLLAQRLITTMTRLDLYQAPFGVTARNLLDIQLRDEWGKRIHIWPPRTNARRTHLALVQAPLGDLCMALCALHLVSRRLKVPFSEWINQNAVLLSLKHRASLLYRCDLCEHCPGCSGPRYLEEDEIAQGVQVFYDLDLLRKTPTAADLCGHWYHAACTGLPDVMRVLKKIALVGWSPEMRVQRARALLLWRTVDGRSALQGAQYYRDYRLRKMEERKHQCYAVLHSQMEIREKYKDVIALITEMHRTFLGTDIDPPHAP